jgi:hypothetical protein
MFNSDLPVLRERSTRLADFSFGHAAVELSVDGKQRATGSMVL